MIENMKDAITNLRRLKPLVLCLTNYVTMDFMANSLLALGAAPIMSICDKEIEELISMAHVVYINIGTLDDSFMMRSHKAAEFAHKYNKPLVLDPVGVGASVIRTQLSRALLSHANLIRGNASEIMALVDDDAKTLGVESLSSTERAKHSADVLALKYDVTVVVSGQEDYITDGHKQHSLMFGSPLMPLITGMGCTLTAVIAAFNTVVADSFEAARLATGYYGLCGNLAQLKANTPGSFRNVFIDELFLANYDAMRQISDIKKDSYAI